MFYNAFLAPPPRAHWGQHPALAHDCCHRPRTKSRRCKISTNSLGCLRSRLRSALGSHARGRQTIQHQGPGRRQLFGQPYVPEAPLIAVFCFNPKLMTITDSAPERPSVVGGGSVYPAVQNFLLACRNEGLGCVLTTLLCYEEDAVKRLFNCQKTGIPARTFRWVIQCSADTEKFAVAQWKKWCVLTSGR